jgi:hypothetical protein
VGRILLVASAEGVTFDRVPALRILLYDATLADGEPLAYFDIKPETGEETALICGELYRRGEGWKFRALGEGYSNGLQGLASDFGIAVDDSEAESEAGMGDEPAAAAPLGSQPLPPEQPTQLPQQPAQPSYGYPPAASAPAEPTRQQPPAAQPAYGYPQPTSQPAYGYPQTSPVQPAAAAAAQPAYGFPQPVGALPDPEFRLPPQGPQFIGR